MGGVKAMPTLPDTITRDDIVFAITARLISGTPIANWEARGRYGPKTRAATKRSHIHLLLGESLV